MGRLTNFGKLHEKILIIFCRFQVIASSFMLGYALANYDKDDEVESSKNFMPVWVIFSIILPPMAYYFIKWFCLISTGSCPSLHGCCSSTSMKSANPSPKEYICWPISSCLYLYESSPTRSLVRPPRHNPFQLLLHHVRQR